MEEWKDIKGYKGLYQVSSLGRVKSLERDIIKCNGAIYHLTERLLKPTTNSVGYLQVSLCKGGKSKWYRIHRLVAEAFIGECPEGYEVDHISTIKTNNRVENLRYCNRKENMNNIATKENRKKYCKPVIQLSIGGDIIAEYPSATEAARQNGWFEGGISCCCNGKGHSYKGFKWQYA